MMPITKSSSPLDRSSSAIDGLGVGLLILAILTLLASGWWIQPAPNPIQPTAADRWLRSFDLNPAARYPLLPAADLHALSFISPKEGFAGGESGTLLKTSDGGKSWTRLDLPSREAVNSLAFDPEN